MRDNLTEYQRQHIIELLERGQGLPHAALGGQRSKAPRLRSSPERDFALFDTGVQCCALRPPAPVGAKKAGRRARCPEPCPELRRRAVEGLCICASATIGV